VKEGVIRTFNRGEVDQRALARTEVKRVEESAALMQNFIPSRLGNMQYRPGFGYLFPLTGANAHYLVPFVSSVTDTALIDIYYAHIYLIVNDVLMSATSTVDTITNGTFAAGITGWTDASGGTATTSWHSKNHTLVLTGDGSSSAVSYQTVTITDTGQAHTLYFTVAKTPVTVKLGTTGASSYDLFKGVLKPGKHFLTITPSANLTITFENSKKYSAEIDDVSFKSGTIDLHATNLYPTSSIRYVQSIDVMFIADTDSKPYCIEHRGDKSWSLVDFRYEDGPFETVNNTTTSMTPSGLSGDISLTSSSDFFTTSHLGALFKLVSSGQKVTASVSVDTGAGTNSIEVTGVSSSRAFTIIANGFVSGTVTLQRSVDGTSWDDVQSYTMYQNRSYNDGFDNSIFYYRLYVKPGDNAATDTLILSLEIASGSITGICRVTKYATTKIVFAQVLQEFGATDATLDWYEGSWSAEQGYPNAVELAEGRLLFSRGDKTWASVSDAYYSFDSSIVGDSASFMRTAQTGPGNAVKWIKDGDEVIIGSIGSEIALRTTTSGGILTASTAKMKTGSTQGSADVDPVNVDGQIYFVQRSGIKLYSVKSNIIEGRLVALDNTILNQTICSAGIKRIAVSRQPETRIWVVLNDGTAAVYTVDDSEDVAGWARITTTNTIEDVVVLPGTDEDNVYFVIAKGTTRYLHKMAQFQNCVGGTTSETKDSYLSLTSPGTTFSVAAIVANGETVGVWADGQDRGTYTVASGQITVATAWTNVIVGQVYTADYTSSKLSGYDTKTVLSRLKRIFDVGLVLMNYWPGSLLVGPETSLLKPLPAIEGGTTVDTTATISDYSNYPFEFDGEDESDPRIYLRATGPVTVLAITFGVDDGKKDTPAVSAKS
jgi:hypothetical protein